MNKYCFIDFEFNNTSEKYLNMVSGAYIITQGFENFEKRTSWLHNDPEEQYDFIEDIMELHAEGYIFVCYQVEAEARSFLSLDHDTPIANMKFIDLWLEYRHLLNHDNQLKYGKQLLNGKIRNIPIPKPKWQRTEQDEASPEPSDGLAAACYKILGKLIDTDRKNAVRDLIISAPKRFKPEERKEILDYNESDLIYMPKLLRAMSKRLKSKVPTQHRKTLFQEMLWRGHYSALNAKMVTHGYPINVEKTRAFSNAVPSIMNSLCRDINSQFDFKPFKFNRKDGSFSFRVKDVRQYIRDKYPELVPRWMRTDGGKSGKKDLSLKLEAWTRFFNFQHDFPRGNFGAQIVRFLKTKQGLNGFRTKEDSSKSTFWDYVGSDGMVRPFMNIYRSQSARSQPSATGFLFLKAAWMRVLCEPPKGKMCVTIDWGSQEFFLGALMSGDRTMIKAYQSGDPYLSFAKEAGAVPRDGKRKDYGPIRDAFKSTTLAEMYMMGIDSLQAKLTNDTGKVYTRDEAEDLDYLFRDVYYDFCQARENWVRDYYEDGYHRSPEGWYMWADNPNFRSIANKPIQNFGSDIMRRAVHYADVAGLTVIKTLHDALYIMCDLNDWEKVDILAHCMDKAFRYYFPKELKDIATCRMDAVAWSPQLFDGEKTLHSGRKVEVKKLYIDKRSLNDYKKFSPYFDTTRKKLF